MSTCSRLRALLSSTILAGAALSAAQAPAVAQTSWTGAVSTGWFTAGNWSNGVPLSGVDTTIDTVTPNAPVLRVIETNDIGTLTVGNTATGKLTIQEGGKLNSGNGIIGRFEGSDGTVTVTGAGSNWTVDSGDVVDGIIVGLSGKGTLVVTNGGAVNSVEGFIGHATTGVGTVVVSGPGSSWTLSENLVVGNQGTGTLTIANGGTVSNQNGFVGNDSIAVGTVIVTGTNSTWINSGDVIVGRFGKGELIVENGGAVNNVNGSIGSVAGSQGTATVTRGGSWTNSGILTVGEFGRGTLNVENGGTVSSASGTIGDHAGATGTVTVTGAGSNWANAGELIVGDLGTGRLTISNGGTVNSSNGLIGSLSNGVDAGTGTVTVTGAGSQWNNSGFLFVGSNGSGTLTVANGGTVSAAQGIQVAIQPGSTGTVNIGGGAGQAAAAPGTLNTPFFVFGDGNGTLNFNHTAAVYTFAAEIGGAGRTNVLAGTTVLTAASINYTGPTTVSGGSLIVNGSIRNSAVTVNAGATLGGGGTVGTTTINGGTLAPGGRDSIGTLAVSGNLALSSAATYLVQVTPAVGDRVNVTGTASVDGTVRVVAASGNYAPGTTYTIVNAGAVTGTFDRVTTNSIFLTPTLIHNANNVLLTLALDFTGVGRTRNQIATARGVQSLGSGNPIFDAIFNIPNADQARAAFDRLSGEVHASAAGVMLDESRHMRDAVLGRARQSYGGTAPAALAALGQPGLGYAQEEPAADTALSYAAVGAPAVRKAPQALNANERVFATWGQAIGAWGHTDGDGNAAALDRKATGVIGGVDATFGDRWRLGVASGYTRSSLSVDARASSAGIDSAHLAAYGGGRLGAWGVRGGAAFTWHEITTRRSIAFPGFADSTKADYRAHSTQAFGELGYSIVAGRAAFEPFAAVAYVNLDDNGFRESGGAAALTAREQSLATTFTTLGLRGAIVLGAGNGMAMTARGTLGWRHAFGDVTPALAFSFASGGVPFTIAGVPIAKDSALVETGFDIDLTSSAKLGLAYSGQLAADAQDHAVKGNFLWKF